MVTIRQERRSDIPAREALLDAAFGAGRFAKAAERLREGGVPADGMAFVAVEDDRVVGTVRLWHVSAGRGRQALLLGPLAVDAEARNRGIGSALMRRALRQAGQQGSRAVLLVGDAPFYGRFGFSAEKTGGLWLPGPYDRHRLLGCELVAGSLDGAHGLIAQSGRPRRNPKLTELIVNLGPGKGAAAAQPV